QAARRGCPVPPRVGPHRRREAAARELLARLMANATLTAAIDKVAAGTDLSADEAAAVLAEIMADQASEIEIAGFLMALRAKGETVDEVAGLARTMRALAAPVDAGRNDLLDTAGT